MLGSARTSERRSRESRVLNKQDETNQLYKAMTHCSMEIGNDNHGAHE